MAIRDDVWDTVEGSIDELTIERNDEAFSINFASRHRSGPVDFLWRGVITGQPDGTIRFGMEGTALSSFMRNRIGIYVLHPPRIAGAAVTIVTPDGPTPSVFPERVAPKQPFTDVLEMQWAPKPGLDAQLAFEGDLFETEDHRNWTDASYKTFSTPLRLPHPLPIERDARISQSVTLKVLGAPRPPTDRVAKHRNDDFTIKVHDEPDGVMPTIGIGLSPERETVQPLEREELRALRPQLIRTVIEVDRPGWQERLAAAQRVADTTTSRLAIEVVAGEDERALHALVEAIPTEASSDTDIFAFPSTGYATTVALAALLSDLRLRSGRSFRIGGGSRANFAEFNRARLPLDLLDVVSFPISPQVHAFDDSSVMEAFEVWPAVLASARAIAGDLPLALGPITLRPRFNPYGVTRPVLGVAAEAGRIDRRQVTMFGGAWTAAALAASQGQGVESVVINEVAGPAGVLARPASRSRDAAPVRTYAYQAIAALTELPGARRLRVTDIPGVATVALRSADSMRVLVANLRDRATEIRVQLPQSATQAASTPLGATAADPHVGGGAVPLRMGAYQVFVINAALHT